jgi:hypothetical protein
MMNTIERMNFTKMKYELGVYKHKCEELQKELDALKASPPDVQVEAIHVGPKLIQKVLPTSCYSSFGLQHMARKYGIPTDWPKPKIIKGIRDYEKANNMIVEKV